MCPSRRPSPRVTRQAEKPLDPKELAAVQKIRARIEEQAGKDAPAAASAAYKVTIPNTTVTYGMAPVPAGEFLMGSAGPGARPDEQPQHKVRLDAFWMQTHEVTWDSYLMFMFADQAKETDHPDAIVDALSRPTGPHLEMSFGRGNNGFPAISMTQHAANKYAEWLSAKTGEYYRLPTEAEWEYACRAGSPTGIPAAQLGDYAWFVDELADGDVFRRDLSPDRHEEAERVGALRHARQRDGVDARSVQAVHERRGRESLGQVHHVLPACRPRRVVARRGRKGELHGPGCLRGCAGKCSILSCPRASGT